MTKGEILEENLRKYNEFHHEVGETLQGQYDDIMEEQIHGYIKAMLKKNTTVKFNSLSQYGLNTSSSNEKSLQTMISLK